MALVKFTITVKGISYVNMYCIINMLSIDMHLDI